jgi:hypothetical protein
MFLQKLISQHQENLVGQDEQLGQIPFPIKIHRDEELLVPNNPSLIFPQFFLLSTSAEWEIKQAREGQNPIRFLL